MSTQVEIEKRERTDVSVAGLPLLRNLHFAGRESELSALRAALADTGLAVLSADGTEIAGVGRTQVALEYACRFAAEYDPVLWFHAKCPAGLAGEYAALALGRDLAGVAHAHQQDMILAARKQLADSDQWLVVFDGLGAPEALERYLPADSRGHAIVLAAGNTWDGPGRLVVVNPWNRAESLAFVSKRIGASDEAASDRLAGLLADMPLALDVASSCMTATGTAPGAMVEMLNERTSRGRADGDKEPTHSDRMAALVGLCVAAAAKENPIAADLFALMAFLAPDDISPTLIRDGRLKLPDSLSAGLADGGMLRKALVTLWKHGLVTPGRHSVYVHPAIQSALRRSLSPAQRRTWTVAAVRLVAGGFPVEEQYTHYVPACSKLLQHVYDVASHASGVDEAMEPAGRLLNQVGLYLRGCGELAEARKCYMHAVAMGERVYGADDPSVAVRVNNLGVVEQDLGNVGEAQRHFERALEICDKAYGPADAMHIMPLRNVCTVVESLGDVDAARRKYKQALKVYLDVLGWAHPVVSECINNLGVILRKQGNHSEARKCFEHAIISEENCESPNAAQLVTYLRNLGAMMLDVGNFPKAREVFERSLALSRQEDLGDEAVAFDLVCLGQAQRGCKRFPEAKAHFQEAISLLDGDGAYPPELHAHLHHNLGKVLMAEKEAERACVEFREVLRIDEALHGTESRQVARDLLDIAKACEELKDFVGAEDCYERALKVEISVNGEQHQDVARALNRWGASLEAQGKLDDAMHCYRRALIIDTAVCGKDDAPVARDTLNIGLVLKKKGDVSGALGNLMRALSIFEQALGPAHPKTRAARASLESLNG